MEELKPSHNSPYFKQGSRFNNELSPSKSSHSLRLKDGSECRSGMYSSKMTNSSFIEKAVAPNYRASVNDAPNMIRLILRFVQFVSSIGAFSFSVGANSFSEQSIPFKDKSGVQFLYFISFFSLLISAFFLLNFYQRRVFYKVKLRRFWLFILDGIVALFWICSVLTLFIRDVCPIGTLNGCLFFSFLATISCIISLIWDFVGTWFQA